MSRYSDQIFNYSVDTLNSTRQLTQISTELYETLVSILTEFYAKGAVFLIIERFTFECVKDAIDRMEMRETFFIIIEDTDFINPSMFTIQSGDQLYEIYLTEQGELKAIQILPYQIESVDLESLFSQAILTEEQMERLASILFL